MGVKVLVTGAGGFLGGNILAEADATTSLHGVDLRPAAFHRENLQWHALDLQDAAALEDLVLGLRPDVIVHTAALSDIDFCESHPRAAQAVNVEVTLHLARLCRRIGGRLVFFSSDSVFDGEKGMYRESDSPSPLNRYAQTKVEAEMGIAEVLPNHLIIRPSLIMGLPVVESGNSFLWRLIENLENGRRSAFPSTEIRTPVDAVSLSRATLEAARLDCTGFLHLAGADRLSRYDMACRIAWTLGYAADLIEDRPPEITTGRARRPADASLDAALARRLLATPLRGLEEGLRLVMESRTRNRQ